MTTPFSTLLRRALVGAVIGFGLISLFIFDVPNPDPAWGENWRLRPLIITPLAGAFASLAFLLNDILRPSNTALRILVVILSVLGFVIGLWLGFVLGLDGTLWD